MPFGTLKIISWCKLVPIIKLFTREDVIQLEETMLCWDYSFFNKLMKFLTNIEFMYHVDCAR